MDRHKGLNQIEALSVSDQNSNRLEQKATRGGKALDMCRLLASVQVVISRHLFTGMRLPTLPRRIVICTIQAIGHEVDTVVTIVNAWIQSGVAVECFS